MANRTIARPDDRQQDWCTKDVTALSLEARELLEQCSQILCMKVCVLVRMVEKV